MEYDKQKLNCIIDSLQAIKDTDYFTYPTADEVKLVDIIQSIETLVNTWDTMHDNNFSY